MINTTHGTRLTPAQDAAVHAAGSSILVSAGAGSGKTTVLAERCAYLIADHSPRVPVQAILAVTFTEAAAVEMRQRIEAALRQRLAQKPNDAWLHQQIALLDSAAISTLHAFCRRLLGRYFAQADVDPWAPVLDEYDAAILLDETIQAIFDRYADRNDALGAAFLDFLDAYAGAGEFGVRKSVLAVHGFLQSLVEPDAWLDRHAERWNTPPFWQNRLIEHLRNELTAQLASLDGLLSAGGPSNVRGVAECMAGMQTYRDAVAGWVGALAGATLEALDPLIHEKIGQYQFPPPPRLSKAIKEGGDDAVVAFRRVQSQLKDIKEKLFQYRLKDAFCRFKMAEWTDGIRRTQPHLELFLTLLKAVRKDYAAAKEGLGVLDFADLERFGLNLLRNETNGVAAALRDRFQHVLVDEFQDTSPIQAEILRLVSREDETGRAANLFTVGDLKQSIYRFRLAEPRLFLNRRMDFQPDRSDRRGHVIELLENFRSTPPVIDAINGVFERLMAADLGGVTYDEHERLKAARTEPAKLPGPPLELHLLDANAPAADDNDEGDGEEWEQIEREAFVVAERIKAIHAEGCPYRDMVILLRSMQTRAGLFVRTLSRLGVPVFAEVAGGFFEATEVLDVLSLLALLDNGQQDIPLAAILRSPFVKPHWSDDELAEIRSRAPRHERFHAAARRYSQSGADVSLRARLKSVLEWLDQTRQRARKRPLADVVWAILEETDYLAYIGGLRHGAQRRANLVRLHEHARRFGQFSRQGLYRFLRFMDNLRASDRELDSGTPVAAAEDVVRVMTIHRCKGLEFPVVFIGELGKRFNRADSSGNILYDRELGVTLKAVDLEKRIVYPTLPHRLVARSAEAEMLAEELRILYVAMTRAKDRLVLAGSGSLERFEQIRQRFAGHMGPLPLLERRTAVSALDWVAASISANAARWTTTDPAAGLYDVRTYAGPDMKSWKIDAPTSPGEREKLEQAARFEIPPPSAAAVKLVERVQRRLTTHYPSIASTRLPAAIAASELKRRWDSTGDEEEPVRAMTSAMPRFGARLDPPRFLQASKAMDASERGTMTHSFLQHLDFSRPCDEADLRDQRDGLLSSGILEEGADQIDLAAIAWFFTTPLAARLRSAAPNLHREWPFVIGVDPKRLESAVTTDDPADVVLVRGIVDVLVLNESGIEIVDYKTDAVTPGPAMNERVELYRGQLAIYSDAVSRTWGQIAQRRSLAFLAARQIVEV